ncbi:MAG: peptidylprolyl isomerase [Deltaproteobacteria bacterium]|nr:peptidylprolyl isomerase [Deltaproteobacteria bacterium]
MKSKPITHRLWRQSLSASCDDPFPALRATSHAPRALSTLPRAISQKPHAYIDRAARFFLRHEPRATCHVLLFRLRATCYALLFFFVAGCSVQFNPSEIIMARVNGEPITAQDMEDDFKASHQGHSAFLAGQGVIREVLEKTIDRQLLLQEAKRIGLEQAPDINHALERVRANRASEQFYRDKITSKVAISDNAIAESHKRMSDRLQTRHILVGSREEAEKVLDRIKGGAEFGEIATEVSQADTAGKGGYMGIIRWGQLELDLEEQLWPLEVGKVSNPFETPDGWNLLYVTEKKSGNPPPLEKVTNQIRAILTKRETKRLSDILLRDLKARWKPQFDETNLSALLKPPDKQQLAPDALLVNLGDDKITVGQILPRISLDKIHKIADAVALRAIENLLDADIFKILIRKEALAQGYGKKPEIKKEVETLRNKLAVDLLLDRVTFAKLDVSDDEAQAYWQTHETRFTDPPAVKLSLIVAETEDEARQILTQLEGGQDFASYARKMSTHSASAALGGDLGWVAKGRLQPEIETVAFSLKEGEFGLAQVQTSHMVIWVEAKKPARLKAFSEVKEQARELALREKAQGTLKIWRTKLREASVIEISDEAINQAATAYQEKFRKKAGQGKGEDGAHGS